MDFVALDFETANADLSSICQVGLVTFRNGEPAETFSTLVDPEDYFDYINISIHGIDDIKVRGRPSSKRSTRKFESGLRALWWFAIPFSTVLHFSARPKSTGWTP